MADESEAAEPEFGEQFRILRVCLSGGGVRATMFGFGAMLYLLDSRENVRVRAVSSVSGGSIANAILAVSADFSAPDVSKAMRTRIGRAAWMLATHGVFFVRNLKSWVRLLFVTAALFAVMTIALPAIILFLDGDMESIGIVYGQTFLALLGFAALIFVFFAAYNFLLVWVPRKYGQISVYARAISYACLEPSKWGSWKHSARSKEAARIMLSDLPDGPITHVFCATDLVSGYPVFMTRKYIENEIYGRGPADLAVAKAIYASAAFPAAFTPLSVSTSTWRGEGRYAVRAPRLLLSDGGVFNNLGTDWFAATRNVEEELQASLSVQEADVLIVNASKPGQVEGGSWRAFRFQVPALVRAMTVVQENTVGPRLRMLQDDPGTAIADIAQSPLALLDHLESHSDVGVRARAMALGPWLREPQRASYWTTLTAETSTTPTQLEAVGAERARHLLRHGYMNAAIAMHCLFDSTFTPRTMDRGEGWFADLLDQGSRPPDPSQGAIEL